MTDDSHTVLTVWSNLTPANTLKTDEIEQSPRSHPLVRRRWIDNAIRFAIIVVLAGFVITLERAPIEWRDEVIYAAIARSIHLRGDGIPSLIRDTPTAVDHEGFYGPVFFRLSALGFSVAGFSISAFRALSFGGALLLAGAGALMAKAFGGGRTRQGLVFFAVLVAPEIGTNASSGRMDTVAVGLGMLGLACFVMGMTTHRVTYAWTIATAAAWSLAALTTPRIYPLLAAITIIFGLSFFITDRHLKSARRHLGLALAVTGVTLAVWATAVHGSPWRWIHVLWLSASQTPVDVATAPHAVRAWEAPPWKLLTLFCSLACVLVGGQAKGYGEDQPTRFAIPASMLRAIVVVNLVVCLALFNLTFVFATYFAVPLLIAAASLPLPDAPRRGIILAALGLFLTCAVGLRAVKYVAVVATWDARNPASIERFVGANVPVGSHVFGSRDFGLYAVSRSGSYFRSGVPISTADWVVAGTPALDRTFVQREPVGPPPGSRFLLWETARPAPDRFSCVDQRHVVASYSPPLALFVLPEFIANNAGTAGYPPLTLYRLPTGCPADLGESAGGRADHATR